MPYVLYGITPPWQGHAQTACLQALEAALRGGLTMLQLRSKTHTTAELLAWGKAIKARTDPYGVPLIINDHLHIAEQLGCGVHLGPSDSSIAEARARLGQAALVGATARTLQAAKAAEAAGASYLGCGAVFPSSTKTDATPLPLDQLRAICTGVVIPVVAIGGITTTNILQLQGCGLAGVAVASGIFAEANIESATRALRQQAERCV